MHQSPPICRPASPRHFPMPSTHHRGLKHLEAWVRHLAIALSRSSNSAGEVFAVARSSTDYDECICHFKCCWFYVFCQCYLTDSLGAVINRNITQYCATHPAENLEVTSEIVFLPTADRLRCSAGFGGHRVSVRAAASPRVGAAAEQQLGHAPRVRPHPQHLRPLDATQGVPSVVHPQGNCDKPGHLYSPIGA